MSKGKMVLMGVLAMVMLVGGIAEAGKLDVLKETGNAFAEIAKDALPAVVYIDVEATVEVPSYRYRNPLEEFFGRGNSWGWGVPEEAEPRKFQQQGQGSGFIISKDGYILTNNHVVKDADRITVTLADGRTFDAKLVGTDPKSEVALIQIEDGGELPYLKLGDSDALGVGEWVLAAGNPFGLSQTVTAGIVSAKGRAETGIAEYGNFIQTDAAINPGNSGGPLLNIKGEVVGINTAIYTRTGGYMGIGFAIPINMAAQIKDQLLEYGKVRRSMLGIWGEDLTEEMAPFFGLEHTTGIIVSKVVPDSAAEEAGLKSEDIILELNGEQIENYASFRNRVAASVPGSTLELKVLRNGKEKTITAVTRAMEGEEMADVDGEDVITNEKLGLSVDNLDSELARQYGHVGEEGVLVTGVEQGSPAWRAGLKPGLVVSSVNREPIANVKQFKKALKASADTEKILLLVNDGRSSRFIVITLD